MFIYCLAMLKKGTQNKVLPMFQPYLLETTFIHKKMCMFCSLDTKLCFLLINITKKRLNLILCTPLIAHVKFILKLNCKIFTVNIFHVFSLQCPLRSIYTKLRDGACWLSIFNHNHNLSLAVTNLLKSKNTGDAVRKNHQSHPPYNSCADQRYRALFPSKCIWQSKCVVFKGADYLQASSLKLLIWITNAYTQEVFFVQ